MTDTFLNEPEDLQWLAETHLADLQIDWTPRAARVHGNEDDPERIDLYPRREPLNSDLPLTGTRISDQYVFCGPLTAAVALAIDAQEREREQRERFPSTDPANAEQAENAFASLPESAQHSEVTAEYEHGQLWIICRCGASWSVVDAEGPGTVDGLAFEQVSDGDPDYHIQ